MLMCPVHIATPGRKVTGSRQDWAISGPQTTALSNTIKPSSSLTMPHAGKTGSHGIDPRNQFIKNCILKDFPGGAVVKNPPANAGDTGSSLVWEDPTCCGATKPMSHNYRTCALEPMSHNYWAPVPQLLSPHSTTREATAMSPRTATKSSPHLLQLEKAHAQQRRPNAAIINK